MASLLYNVMEEVTIPEYPIIREIKEKLTEHGALHAIMSGSGPTVFALFDQYDKAVRAKDFLERSGLTEQLYLTEFIN